MMKFQLTDLENLLSDELRQGGPEVEQNQGFAADNLATIIPAGHDLEVQSSLSLGCDSSLMMTGFRVRYCTL